MTNEGVVKLLLTMTRAYPTYRPSDIEATAKVWKSMLKDYDDHEIALALEAFIKSDTKGFAPAIGQLIDLITVDADELSEMQAWDCVSRAIRNGNYGAEYEFDRLPEAVQIAVGSPVQIREWAKTSVDSIQTVVQSNFLRSYRAVLERQKKIDKMPDELKKLYQKTVARLQYHTEEAEDPAPDGIPMPEELKAIVDNWRNDK